MGAFDGGAITSNGGVVLLAAADRAIRLSQRLSECFTDLRLADAVRHSVPDLLCQRIFGLALGHEDLIDHDVLRNDPALTAALDKRGGQLAGKSNRLKECQGDLFTGRTPAPTMRANQLRLWLSSFA